MIVEMNDGNDCIIMHFILKLLFLYLVSGKVL